MRAVIIGGVTDEDNTQAGGDKGVRVKAWHIVFLVIVVLATLALAYWQWSRFQSGSGTFQNLGYAFQWPLFGAFAIYAYRMGLKLEREANDAHAKADDPDYLYEADLREFGTEVTSIDDDFLPARPQIDVETFNEINQQRRGVDPTTGEPVSSQSGPTAEKRRRRQPSRPAQNTNHSKDN